MVVTLDFDTGLAPVDLELLPALYALVRLRALRKRRARAAVGADAVCSPKLWRRSTIVLRALHHGPALWRSLPDLEPRPQHAHGPAVHFDNSLKIIEFEHAVPCAASKLERNIGLDAGKKKRHHDSWVAGRREGRGHNIRRAHIRNSQELSQPTSKTPLHFGQRMLVACSSRRARSRQLGQTP